MALTLLTPRQETLIVNNVVAACRDIERLNRTGYKFINLCAGFIAHYDLYGFRAAYGYSGKLAQDIMRNRFANEWKNFHVGERDYDYYQQKARVYARIVEAIR